MRSIYNEEIDLVWSNYENLINRLGFYKMLETSDEELQQIFTMKYKDLYYQVKNANIDKGIVVFIILIEMDINNFQDLIVKIQMLFLQ